MNSLGLYALHREKLKGVLKGDYIEISKNENSYWRVYYSSGYGEESDKYITLTMIEALHLVDRGLLEIVTVDKKEVRREDLFSKINKVRDWPLYIVYKDLRNRGYTVKLSRNPPISIYLYPRGKNIFESRPAYGVFIVEASKEIKLTELDEAIRTSKELGMKLLISIVDEIGDVTYYEIEEALDENK